MNPLAFTRAISPSIDRCILTHLERTPIDFARAVEEHAAYEAALRELGVDVRRLPDAPDLPDAVFVEDTAVILDEIAILARPGEPARRLEIAPVAEALSAVRRLEVIEPPGTLDGGDVLRLGDRLFVGRTVRTNDAGREQLRALVGPAGYEVVPVEVRGCLHLKSAVTVVADGTLLWQREWLDPSPFDGWNTIAVDPEEPFAANALRIAGTIIHPEHFSRTRTRLEAEGLQVLPVSQRELARAEGGVTCGCLLVE